MLNTLKSHVPLRWFVCDCNRFVCANPPRGEFPMSDYMTRRPECHPLSAAGRKLDRRLRWERMFTVVAMCASFCVVTGAVWYLAMAPVVVASGVEIQITQGGK